MRVYARESPLEWGFPHSAALISDGILLPISVTRLQTNPSLQSRLLRVASGDNPMLGTVLVLLQRQGAARFTLSRLT